MRNKDKAILDIIDDPVVNIDLLQHLLGDYVSEGQYRYVFEFGKNQVAKIDVGDALANATEFITWADVKGYPRAAKWFAPVIRCSVGAKILIMKKADMNRPVSEYPKKIPDFFGDVKKSNFGFIGKQFVCVDYGLNYLNIEGIKNFKMRTINWLPK